MPITLQRTGQLMAGDMIGVFVGHTKFGKGCTQRSSHYIKLKR
jgi:hypothetical protein